MVTTWYKDEHFICKLKMEAEIACAHTVKLTAPGLTIDKAGSVANELTYDFAAGAGLVEQDVGIIGAVAGRFKLYGKITSPFFISGGVLKVKKDEIDVVIIDEPRPDGWYGSMAGVYYGANEADSVPSSLHLRYTNPSVTNQYLKLLVDASPFNAQMGIKVTHPDGVVGYGGYNVPGGGLYIILNLTKIGQYIIHILDIPVVAGYSGYPSVIGNNTYSAQAGTGASPSGSDVVIGTKIVKGTGIQVLNAKYFYNTTHYPFPTPPVNTDFPFASNEVAVEVRVATSIYFEYVTTPAYVGSITGTIAQLGEYGMVFNGHIYTYSGGSVSLVWDIKYTAGSNNAFCVGGGGRGVGIVITSAPP